MVTTTRVRDAAGSIVHRHCRDPHPGDMKPDDLEKLSKPYLAHTISVEPSCLDQSSRFVFVEARTQND